jgi:hypothetical protein
MPLDPAYKAGLARHEIGQLLTTRFFMMRSFAQKKLPKRTIKWQKNHRTPTE